MLGVVILRGGELTVVVSVAGWQEDQLGCRTEFWKKWLPFRGVSTVMRGCPGNF